MKVGGEYVQQQNPVFLCNRCMGIYDASGGAVPANIESLFPVWNDVSTWNLAALSPIVRTYTLGVGQMKQYAPLKVFAGWLQDDWQVSNKLTLNLGLRYDLETGVYAEDVELEPFLKAGRKDDTNNWGPRLGATFSLTDKTVLRGGAGRYFADPGSHTAYWTKLSAYALHPQVLNDGRADFASNPFNGPIPTFDQVAATLCTVAPGPNCLRRSIGTFAAPYNEIPYSNQASVGVQRQFGSVDGVRGRLRLHGQPRAELRDERQSGLRPGHRRQLSLHQHRQAALSGLGHRDEPPVGGRVQLSRPADGVHEADDQPLAGVGDLPALRPVEPAERADSRRAANIRPR